MFRKLLFGALAALAITPAHAALQLAFANSGGGSFFCADQTVCDLDGAARNLLLLNTMVGDIRIEGTFAASTVGPDRLSVSNLTITNLGSSTETLTMAVGDTGFTTPVSFIRSSASATFNTDNGAAFDLRFFADHGDAQPAATAFDLPGVNLFSVLGSVAGNPDSASGTHDSAFVQGLGVFSMAEGASLALTPGASITGFNQSMASGVPEPSTWAMLIIGAISLALGARTRRPAREIF
jgi:hypothetical protein